MRHAAVTRIVLLAVVLASVVRAICDVSCVHVPDPTPAPCHGAAPENPASDCSHDHDRIAARPASAAIEHHAAILPGVIVSTGGPHAIAVCVAGEARPLVPRASPLAILRV